MIQAVSYFYPLTMPISTVREKQEASLMYDGQVTVSYFKICFILLGQFVILFLGLFLNTKTSKTTPPSRRQPSR